MELKYNKILKMVDDNGVLDISNKNITKIEKLPNNLKELYCYNNKLVELPLLPDNLKILYCGNNKLIYKSHDIEDIRKEQRLIKRKRKLNGIKI